MLRARSPAAGPTLWPQSVTWALPVPPGMSAIQPQMPPRPKNCWHGADGLLQLSKNAIWNWAPL